MNTRGSASPSEQGMDHHGLWNQTHEFGMTLRDWFAGQALVSMRAELGGEDSEIAKYAYDLADAMIAERDKEA